MRPARFAIALVAAALAAGLVQAPAIAETSVPITPSGTVVLDVDPVTGLGRAGDPDRIEREPAAFHARVRQHFLELAAADPGHYVVVDGSGTREHVHAAVRAAVEPWLSQAAVSA